MSNLRADLCTLELLIITNIVYGLDFSPSKGELHVVARGRNEKQYGSATIDLTDDLKKLIDSIIECSYVDHHWIFVRVRNDRKHPNGYRSVDGTFD